METITVDTNDNYNTIPARKILLGKYIVILMLSNFPQAPSQAPFGADS